MIVAGLVVLAVVASLFLIFSDSVQLLRIGLVAALWAAVIGAIAMTKYRRESAADKAKIRDLQTVYELQLEREVTARREYESGVEARVRSEMDIDVSEIAALRTELAALRGSLEALFEGRLPVDRVAIESDAARRGQLGAAPSARPSVPFAPNPAYANPAAGPSFATPFDEPVTAEVSVLHDEGGAGDAPADLPDTREPAAPEPVTAPRRVAVPEPVAAAEPVAVPEPEIPAQDTARAAAADAAVVTADAAVVTAGEGAEVTASPAEPESEATPTVRRRRRAAEENNEVGAAGAHSSGLTVAEIMASMQAQGGDSDGPRQGRRRRE